MSMKKCFDPRSSGVSHQANKLHKEKNILYGELQGHYHVRNPQSENACGMAGSNHLCVNHIPNSVAGVVDSTGICALYKA